MLAVSLTIKLILVITLLINCSQSFQIGYKFIKNTIFNKQDITVKNSLRRNQWLSTSQICSSSRKISSASRTHRINGCTSSIIGSRSSSATASASSSRNYYRKQGKRSDTSLSLFIDDSIDITTGRDGGVLKKSKRKGIYLKCVIMKYIVLMTHKYSLLIQLLRCKRYI